MCYTSPSASKSINSHNVSYLCISRLYTKKFSFSKHPFLITKYPLSSLCHQHYVPLVNCFLQIFWTSRTFHPQRLNKHDLRERNCEVQFRPGQPVHMKVSTHNTQVFKGRRKKGRRGGGKEGTGRPAHNHQLPRASRSQHWARHTLHLTSPVPYILEMTSGDQ